MRRVLPGFLWRNEGNAIFFVLMTDASAEPCRGPLCQPGGPHTDFDPPLSRETVCRSSASRPGLANCPDRCRKTSPRHKRRHSSRVRLRSIRCTAVRGSRCRSWSRKTAPSAVETGSSSPPDWYCRPAAKMQRPIRQRAPLRPVLKQERLSFSTSIKRTVLISRSRRPIESRRLNC